MSPDTQTIAPIKKTVEVPLAPGEAVRLFTTEIDSWWPRTTHSVGEEHTTRIGFEPHEGGRVYETTDDGSEHEWGRVTTWDPPGRIIFSWYPSRGPETAQEIELHFVPTDTGTRLEFEHRGWEVMGERAAEMAADYASGWDTVLGRYVAAA